jgi:hypothetical protein
MIAQLHHQEVAVSSAVASGKVSARPRQRLKKDKGNQYQHWQCDD